MATGKYNCSSYKTDPWGAWTSSENAEERRSFLSSCRQEENENFLLHNSQLNIRNESDKEAFLHFTNMEPDSETESIYNLPANKEKYDIPPKYSDKFHVSKRDTAHCSFEQENHLILNPQDLNPEFETNLNRRLPGRNNFPKRKFEFVRGSATRKTVRKKKKRFVYYSRAKRNSILLAKKCSYKPRAILYHGGVSDNLCSALFTTIFCCPLLGIAALYFSLKVRENRKLGRNELAQRNSLIGRKLANTGIMLGMTAFAFVLIFFLLQLDVPYLSVEYEFYIPDYNN